MLQISFIHLFRVLQKLQLILTENGQFLESVWHIHWMAQNQNNDFGGKMNQSPPLRSARCPAPAPTSPAVCWYQDIYSLQTGSRGHCCTPLHTTRLYTQDVSSSGPGYPSPLQFRSHCRIIVNSHKLLIMCISRGNLHFLSHNVIINSLTIFLQICVRNKM